MYTGNLCVNLDIAMDVGLRDTLRSRVGGVIISFLRAVHFFSRMSGEKL